MSSTVVKKKVKKIVFPVYLRPKQYQSIEKARRVDAAGAPLKKAISRSQFMREAIMREVERRLAMV